MSVALGITGRSRAPVIGTALGSVAVLHLALAPVLYDKSIQSIFSAGVLGSIDADPAMTDLRSAGGWYWMAGISLLVIAVLVGQAERREGVVPAAAVVALLVLSAFGLLLMPVSGFLIILAIAGYGLYRRRVSSQCT
ncbi:DUF6463 family protein [Humibacillus sp. DSM 29435]|uniref:DUF6463 family protein n=1 Tax=Humibacillus sp. DSM 29435 TaxID=1869167 RepID=UPI0008727696|nr:DUF6463 family protein [Humibacillus sp. DSM 29435]